MTEFGVITPEWIARAVPDESSGERHRMFARLLLGQSEESALEYAESFEGIPLDVDAMYRIIDAFRARGHLSA